MCVLCNRGNSYNTNYKYHAWMGHCKKKLVGIDYENMYLSQNFYQPTHGILLCKRYVHSTQQNIIFDVQQISDTLIIA